MSFDCVVMDSGGPRPLGSSLYVVVAGDTLTRIAAKFGFATWQEIYYHPDNAGFRSKRPNPDKIYVGDELMIPNRGDSLGALPVPVVQPFFTLPTTGVPGGGSVFGFSGARAARSDPLDLNYKHPGNVKIRLTLFWVTNCVKIDTSPGVVLKKAEELYRAHNLGLDIFPPSGKRTKEHTIEAPVDLLLPEHYNQIRLEAHRRFDDQKTKDKRQRLPVFFCEFKDPANGLTIRSNWPPYVFVSGVLTSDHATLAHEIVHAAGILGHDKLHKKNIMSDLTDRREEIFRYQVERVAGAYFCK